MPTYYEFFAGGGMVSAALRPGWTCLVANDLSPVKARAYRGNWGGAPFREGDVADLTTADLPGRADLCWASTPCQDLSLAGDGAGLGGPDDAARTRSGAVWPWLRLMRDLGAEGRLPRLCVFENVVGALSSQRGRGFAALAGALAGIGYRLGAMVIDARSFLPQSRPRLFVVCAAADAPIPRALAGAGPSRLDSVARAAEALPAAVQGRWIWWQLKRPDATVPHLEELIDAGALGWHADAATARLLAMMAPDHIGRVEAAVHRSRAAGNRPEVGTLYRRTRPDAAGGRRQRAEVRFDGVAGCLRTASGGSSRQTVMLVEGDRIRTRLLSPREAARLMGLPDAYRLPPGCNDAYDLAGDGVAVPVVRHLATHLLEPILTCTDEAARLAAD